MLDSSSTSIINLLATTGRLDCLFTDARGTAAKETDDRNAGNSARKSADFMVGGMVGKQAGTEALQERSASLYRLLSQIISETNRHAFR